MKSGEAVPEGSEELLNEAERAHFGRLLIDPSKIEFPLNSLGMMQSLGKGSFGHVSSW